MGVLKMKEELLIKKADIIKEVLEHFSSKELTIPKHVVEGISAAADNAFADDILFEEFENWADNNDDESFLFLINHYWENKNVPQLPLTERDLTGKEGAIQAIKENAKLEVSQKFALLIRKLSDEKNLVKLEAIGAFLGVSAERARVLLEGKHKPNRATILKVSEKFRIPMDEIFSFIHK